MSPEKIHLEKVQETLLLPLWGRFVENQKHKPLLVDRKAEEIIRKLDYDFSKFEKSVNPLSRAAWIARSIYFDEKIAEHLAQYPAATIVNLGCGLDTTFDRVNNGQAHWYEIDFPEVIELRKKLLAEAENRTFIGDSALSEQWYEKVAARKELLIFMGGVIYYFDEADVKRLMRNLGAEFGRAVMAFDYSSIKGVEITNKKVLEEGGMSQAKAKWGIDDIYEIEKWQPGIKVLENMTMFAKHKRKYPLCKRLGMNISDRMKVMSLARIEIAAA